MRGQREGTVRTTAQSALMATLHLVTSGLSSVILVVLSPVNQGSPRGSGGKEPACNAGDLGSIPGSGRSPGEGNGNPLQYSCLENPMDREAWRAAVHGVTTEATEQACKIGRAH